MFRIQIFLFDLFPHFFLLKCLTINQFIMFKLKFNYRFCGKQIEKYLKFLFAHSNAIMGCFKLHGKVMGKYLWLCQTQIWERSKGQRSRRTKQGAHVVSTVSTYDVIGLELMWRKISRVKPVFAILIYFNFYGHFGTISFSNEI